MIKIKDQCKQAAPARVFHLSLAGAAFYILSLIRCGGLFKFCRDLLEKQLDKVLPPGKGLDKLPLPKGLDRFLPGRPR